MSAIPLIENDTLLMPFENQIRSRIEWFAKTLGYINDDFGNLHNFASAHKYFGFNYDEKLKGWWFREWLPNAFSVSLIGDFNQWDKETHSLIKKEFGVWELFLSDADYATKLIPFSKVKIHIKAKNGDLDRIPAYIQRVVQKDDNTFDGEFLGKNTFQWTDTDFKSTLKNPIVYECHIGMAQEDAKIGTYKEFENIVLPRIKKLGYNCIQMMAIQEHPYYASFGYQVSSYFSPSSRFGTPDDLRSLINTAHNLGISVILDVVHSHSVKNRDEGLSELDGTDIYFSGTHPDWDSRLFSYEKIEVKRFLTSNLTYWMEDFHFDGFRFDGVTSMLYNHFGHVSFDSYGKYFEDTNNDAIIYLQLANELIKTINPNAISICEDMSGMPGACEKVRDGGLGFDYRLAMGIPDFWIKLLETTQDEDWQMGEVFWRLTNRRYKEKTIAYAESHDQALVGDKTIAFWLMDKEMYEGMSVFSQNIVVDRGIAFHNMIRFITIVLGGDGYMNFMGNEFGHPEWVDFPREGNNWSCHYARRQWSLADAEHLKYKYLQDFDQAMLKVVTDFDLLGAHSSYKLHEDNVNKTLIFQKNDLIFVFNFGQKSIENYQFNLNDERSFKTIFTSESPKFGGFDRLNMKQLFKTTNTEEGQKMSIYLPNRSMMVLRAEG